jgi:acyl-CoA reductase-like NAD-dependent aldehyde dehydrogenase
MSSKSAAKPEPASRRQFEEALAAVCRLHESNAPVPPARRRLLLMSLAAAICDHLDDVASREGPRYDSSGETLRTKMHRAD